MNTSAALYTKIRTATDYAIFGRRSTIFKFSDPFIQSSLQKIFVTTARIRGDKFKDIRGKSERKFRNSGSTVHPISSCVIRFKITRPVYLLIVPNETKLTFVWNSFLLTLLLTNYCLLLVPIKMKIENLTEMKIDYLTEMKIDYDQQDKIL